MPSVKFYLKKSDEDEKLIVVSFTFNRQRFKGSTGQKIKKRFWNSDKGMPVGAKVIDPATGVVFNPDELTHRLKKIKSWFEDEYRRQVNDGIDVTAETIREAYQIFQNRKVYERTTLLSYLDRYIDKTRGKYNWRTTNSYELLAKRLKEFGDQGNKVDFDNINKQFYNDFSEYLSELTPRTGKKVYDQVTKKMVTVDRKLKDVSAAKMFKCLKRVMNEAVDEGMTTNTEHRRKYFKVFDEPADSVFLSVDEIDAMYRTKIEDGYLAFKRDLFVLSCYTGLRYSDWNKYTKDNIIEDGKFLKVFTFKTGEMVIIPLNPVAREIFERYEGTNYVIPSNQKMNKTLKKIGQLADMIQTITTSSTFGGNVTTVLRTKWELVTCHTARRSFATNAFLSGIPTISIMRITGHRTERSFLRYIRIDQLQNAMKLADHPFFS